jgi:hypothetical protein
MILSLAEIYFRGVSGCCFQETAAGFGATATANVLPQTGKFIIGRKFL